MADILELRPVWRLVHAGLVSTGIEAARTQRPDLILLDMHLPDGTGDQVLTALKQDRETSDIPVVVLSAGTIGAKAAPLVDAGADQFWTKPHDLGLMLEYFDELAARL
ncbi:response regulator [Dermatophilaceae bacterium Soc4.6]